MGVGTGARAGRAPPLRNGMSARRHLAELNFGTLRYDWGDPRIEEFQSALGKVAAIAERSPGFIWQMDEDQMDVAQQDPSGPFGDNPRTASTLSVWADVESLVFFVERSVHGRYLRRAEDWFEPGDRGHLVLWWVPMGHKPTLAEGMKRYRMLREDGPSDAAFDFDWLRRTGELPEPRQ